eukprot:5617998-Alexandrium_andersonii.AAC.1
MALSFKQSREAEAAPEAQARFAACQELNEHEKALVDEGRRIEKELREARDQFADETVGEGER